MSKSENFIQLNKLHLGKDHESGLFLLEKMEENYAKRNGKHKRKSH